MIIYTTDSQMMAEELICNDKTEEEVTKIIEKIYSDLNLDMIPGATLIGDSIIADNFVAAIFLEKYGFAMEEINLHKLCA